MRDAYAFHRLRKYQRKKDRARDQKAKWNRLTKFYWRYWFRVYVDHENLWADPD